MAESPSPSRPTPGENPADGRGRIYLDHAATSWPKPACVLGAMMAYAGGGEVGGAGVAASAGRGAYAEARASGRILRECRERVNTLINGQSADHVVFTLNCSDALNLAIKGLVNPGAGDHVVTTHLAHNSVLRPLNALASRGDTEQTRVPLDPATGLVDPDDIRKAITKRTRLIAVVHGSNVTGSVLPIEEVGRIAREHDVPLLCDAAQTIGHRPIDVRKTNVDLLAFPGHKGLLGPLGTGGLYVRPGMEKRLRTYREGGTGSASELDLQPETMPDKYEAGSHNAIGIAGLNAAVQWILDRGVESIERHERALVERMLARLAGEEMPGLRLIGPATAAQRCGVFSVVVEGLDPSELSTILEDHYGILTRSGFHCAPLAHKAMRTAKHGGTTRFSFGVSTTEAEVDAACDALAEICREHATVNAAP